MWRGREPRNRASLVQPRRIVAADSPRYFQIRTWNCLNYFLSPYSLAVDNSGYEYLLFKDVNFIRQAYPVAATTGVPKHYALFDDTTFILGPTPNANFTVELHYFYEPESITVASSGTSWLGSNAENALLYGCLIEAYTYIKGEPDLMQLYQVRYESAMQELIALGEGYSTTDSYRAGSVRSDR